MICVDSNIWCYFFDESSKEHGKVSAFMQKILGKEEIVINTVILIEISHFLIKNLGPINGKKKIDIFLEFPLSIADLNYAYAKESIDFLCQYSHQGIGGRDATILATMKKLGIKRIVTHDASFKNIDWLEAIDPVK